MCVLGFFGTHLWVEYLELPLWGSVHLGKGTNPRLRWSIHGLIWATRPGWPLGQLCLFPLQIPPPTGHCDGPNKPVLNFWTAPCLSFSCPHQVLQDILPTLDAIQTALGQVGLKIAALEHAVNASQATQY
ncbi:hypothetical protein VP01_3139g4 [Puccinia sorghi]|uniref:Uncharacterized protein n=1 Tax=Puccinia sorghi TaxID=27349 RepID=A0A0L6UYZ3_9BASI|nr:hypothetical protein VP01_3139g4 [Puccinia sorghi]